MLKKHSIILSNQILENMRTEYHNRKNSWLAASEIQQLDQESKKIIKIKTYMYVQVHALMPNYQPLSVLCTRAIGKIFIYL